MTAGGATDAEVRARAARVPDVVALEGPGAEVTARVLGLFEAEREARLALARERHAHGTPRIWVGATVGVLAIGGALLGHPVGLLGLVLAIPLLMAGGQARSEGAFYAGTLLTAVDAQALLAAFLPDLHPQGRAELRLDLRPTLEVGTTVRTATSPDSGKPKRYYRHVYLGLRAPLVDGSPLAVEIARMLKTRNGTPVASRLEVRGRLAPRHGRLAGERRFGALTAVGSDRDGRAEVAFWGTFLGPHDLVAALRDLGRAIAARPA